MDADILQVYKRLSAKRHKDCFEWYDQLVDFTSGKTHCLVPDLCTAEMTTFLKETTNGTAT